MSLTCDEVLRTRILRHEASRQELDLAIADGEQAATRTQGIYQWLAENVGIKSEYDLARFIARTAKFERRFDDSEVDAMLAELRTLSETSLTARLAQREVVGTDHPIEKRMLEGRVRHCKRELQEAQAELRQWTQST